MEPDELESLNHTLDILVEEMTAKARQTAAEQKAKKKDMLFSAMQHWAAAVFCAFLP